MHFRGTAESMFMMLLVALAIVVLHSLVKRKLESNLPLLFYAAVIVFMSATDRAVDAPLVLCGLAATLTLRFEFMNREVTNVARLVAMAALGGIVFQFVTDAFQIAF